MKILFNQEELRAILAEYTVKKFPNTEAQDIIVIVSDERSDYFEVEIELVEFEEETQSDE